MVAAVLSIAAIGFGVAFGANEIKERERLSMLRSEARRYGIEIMSQTLNGNLMGSVAVLGLLDEEIKQETQGRGQPNGPRLQGMLESVARAYDAHGVFLVGQDGVVQSSWDSSGKPSTGIDVRFRPYYQMVMQRKENVYAAVSMARGDRSLYFAAPVLAGRTRDGAAVGGVVARTDLSRIDGLLRDKSDITLLLSPQGVVFAGNRGDWIGFLAERPTPERLAAIRDLKQFGSLFEINEPSILPVSVGEERAWFDGRRYALANARVQWNDPFGDWTLVLMEDLSRTVPRGGSALVGGGAALAAGILLLTLLNMLRSRHAQQVSARQVTALAQAQRLAAERKALLAGTALRLQQARGAAELADAFLRESHTLLGTLQGLVYVGADDAGAMMRLAAGYATGAGVSPEIRPGEGLLGQCAVDRRMRVVAMPADDTWVIRSGLGDTRPRAVVMAPILLNESLLGVVEVALLDIPDGGITQQFEDMVRILALNLELVRRHERGGDTSPSVETP
ncbi:C4-dicarboxylate transport sensor protein dctB [Paramagnetospirillum caucaseum]|uniref:C4-dicarboxylate transport sensor protein dctB n=2 Tax=Paramagnetospirillum caucaseum TaxID=1244869 RepID=M3AAE3_9PROT|nr:C4-dicarboxylate transport sensor protein dctB [Paramagnetospirillum caucaseum]